MNVKNNKRRKESKEKIEKDFIELLQTYEIKDITVSEIIKMTGLNRSTFYANYVDIFDLADKTREKLEKEFSNLFADYDYFNERTGALKMFRHIKENQIFYKTYFKLCYDDKFLISVYDAKRAEKSISTATLNIILNFSGTVLTLLLNCGLQAVVRNLPKRWRQFLKQNTADGRLKIKNLKFKI